MQFNPERDKILFIWPGAEFAIYDVAKGLNDAFIKQGVKLADYRLYNRLRALNIAAEQQKPSGSDVNMETVCLHAAEGIPYKAISENCKYAFIVSGLWLHPNAILALRRIGVKIITYFTEAPYDSNDNAELQLAELTDLAFVNDRSAVNTFQHKLDKHTHGVAAYLPPAYDPSIHKPPCASACEAQRDIDLLLVGTGFVERQALLEQMSFDNINFLLGGMWPMVKPPSYLSQFYKLDCVSNRQVINYYHRTKVGFNPYRYSDSAESINPRCIELAATKTFQISDFRQEQQEVFGDSIPTYNTPWQAEALIRDYINKPEARERMAQANYEKVQKYTFDNNVKTILTEMTSNIGVT